MVVVCSDGDGGVYNDKYNGYNEYSNYCYDNDYYYHYNDYL